MKQILIILIIMLCLADVHSQTCSSLRYQDTIFHQVTSSTIQFGTATPYGFLAQPQDLYLDFYEPTGDTLTQRPLIVFQFGGGFTIGWRSEPDIPQFCEYFAKCGYAVASIDYRIGLNPADSNSTVRAYYRGVQDERSAIRFLCQRMQQFHIDTTLLILTGTSAGCFCAFANAFTSESDRPVSSYGSVLEPDDLGCLDCSGNNDFGRRIPHIKAIINQWGAMMDTSLIEPHENTHVISFHGDQDILVPYVYGYPFSLPVFPPVFGSATIHERLTNMGIPNVLHPLVGFGHEPELLAPHLNDTIYNYSREFLFPLLRPNTSEISGDSVICMNLSARYAVLPSPGSKYCWTLGGNGTIISNTGNAITVEWADTGTVTVSVKEVNRIEAEGEERTFFTYVAPAVIADFDYTADELHVEFSNRSIHAENYFWTFGDGDTSNAENPVKDYPAGGTYTISLFTANGICDDTAFNSITIDSCPVAAITTQITNLNSFFYTPNTNTLYYSWNFGDGDSTSVNFPNVFHQYGQTGTFVVILKVRNLLGCEVADTIVINLVPNDAHNLSDEPIFVGFHGGEITFSGLKLNEGKPGSLELLNIYGERIYFTLFSGFNGVIKIENHVPGIYLVNIKDGEKQLTKKVLIY